MLGSDKRNSYRALSHPHRDLMIKLWSVGDENLHVKTFSKSERKLSKNNIVKLICSSGVSINNLEHSHDLHCGHDNLKTNVEVPVNRIGQTN